MTLPDHIPKRKQKELTKITDIILVKGSETVTIEMILLYGSYARGDFVERDISKENNHTVGYHSDFDIFVITKKGNFETDRTLETRLKNSSCPKGNHTPTQVS